MRRLTVVLLLLNFQTFFCHENINNIFQEINENTLKFNKIASDIAWKSSIEPDNPNLPLISSEYQNRRIKWQQNACEELGTLNLHSLNDTQKRMRYLLCRGPKFTYKEARYLSSLSNYLQTRYENFEACLRTSNVISKSNLTELENIILDNLNDKTTGDLSFTLLNEMVCLTGETAFDKLMSFSKNERVLLWLWLRWREVGLSMKEPYEKLVNIENVASRRNGYNDIGAAWRDELEIPHLRSLCRHLYHKIKPLYQLIHGVVRYFLRRQYGDVVPETGYIPAHLLGSLWSQNWDSLIDIMIPQTIDLDESIKQQNWTVIHMVKRADDFYQSLGLPPMPDSFWRESVFSRESDVTRCHGAAADMFNKGDYRLIYCSGTSMQDFYVLHHEMGHIQYYMAYVNQPGLFRQANTALHESIGDAIMYGVMTPQHLYRLGLVNDTIVYNNAIAKTHETTNESDNLRDENVENNNNINKVNDNKQENIGIESTDDIIMLKQALNKIPQIPFSLIIDEYRWKYFEGSIDKGKENAMFWNMVEELSGIAPPTVRGEEYFDAAAKFHVPDNTPYIRYFLSSFLQHQIFEVLCKAAVFGRRDTDEAIPDSITLNRCDIYGSKTVGKILKDLMSQGHSKHWRDILESSVGVGVITASSLLRYYRPLQELLEKFAKKYNVPIGW